MLKYLQCVKSRSNLLRLWYLGYMQDLDRLTGWLRNMNHITLKFCRLLFVAFHKFQFSGPLQQATLGLLSHIEPFWTIQVMLGLKVFSQPFFAIFALMSNFASLDICVLKVFKNLDPGHFWFSVPPEDIEAEEQMGRRPSHQMHPSSLSTVKSVEHV